MADIGAPFLAAVCTLGGKILFDWLTAARKSKYSNGSGDKPPEFWEQKFREIMLAALESRAPMMQARAELLQKTCDENRQLLMKILEKLERRR